jgi:ATP-dependent Clp protease ATP-binding subunit ClpC
MTVLTDSLGRKIDFKNTIIIMTSNVGAETIKEILQGVFWYSCKNCKCDDNSKNIRNALKNLRRDLLMM